MERSNQMYRQISAMRQSLFDRGYLDEQFIQLEKLQDDTNPNFVEEVATLYYRDSLRLLNAIEQAFIGAIRVKSECGNFRECCRTGNGEGCIKSFQQLTREYAVLKKKLETYFQLVRQTGPRDQARRPI